MRSTCTGRPSAPWTRRRARSPPSRTARISAGRCPAPRCRFWTGPAGDRLLREDALAWHTAAPAGRIHNAYGPTETTITCTGYLLPDDPGRWPRPDNGTLPIGLPYPGTSVLLIDERGRVAEEGEICLRGDQLFDGYLDGQDNGGRFVRVRDGVATAYTGGEPLTREHWYRSGDRARWSEAGLVHLGRTDRQVKRNGYRVELGEVEAAVRSCPGVAEAAVVLAVDFGPRQGEAGFARLAKLLPPGPGVYVTVPPRAAELGRVDVTLADYVRPWLDGMRAWKPRVAAVLTFCAGSAFADAVRSVAGSPDDVPLVLLDPLRVTRHGVLQEYEDATATWREVAGKRITSLGRYAEEQATTVPEMCCHTARAYGEVVAEAGARTGIPDRLTGALRARFADFMAYLAAGADEPVPPADLVVYSAGGTEPVSSGGGGVLHVPEDRSRLLASPAVAAAIGARCATRRATTPPPASFPGGRREP